MMRQDALDCTRNGTAAVVLMHMCAAAPARAARASRAGLFALVAGLCACSGVHSTGGSGAVAAPALVDAGTRPLSDCARKWVAGVGPWALGPDDIGTTSELRTYENSNGSGHGRGIGGVGPPVAMPAAVTPDAAKVRGALDREIVRRIVRSHMRELLACYEPAVARRPRLAGRLTVEVTIKPSGNVGAAVVRRATVRDASVGTCFVDAIRRWQFPRPLEGQNVVVSQRFTLTPPHGPSSQRAHGERQ